MNQVDQNKELRTFGLLVGGIFLAIGLWPAIVRGDNMRLWALGLGGGLASLGAAFPMSLKHIHAVWMKVGHMLGAINTKILLGIVFYGLITPMGLIMRLVGKDFMGLTFASDASTYRVVRKARSHAHMKNQF